MSLLLGRTGNLRRRFNMESLLANNAEVFPCLAPVVGRGKTLLAPESYDQGIWRIARSPLQLAVENGLLLDGEGKPFTEDQILRRGLGYAGAPAYGRAQLDKEKAAEVLRAQLGKAFAGFGALNAERKAMASAFLAYASGDKKDCLSILDELSVSYTETEAGVPACPVLETSGFKKQVTRLWNKNKKLLFSDPLLKRHTSYEQVWFMALLTCARRKGVLATSQFLFLRPLDRPLWYALNQCGGRASWAEAVACSSSDLI